MIVAHLPFSISSSSFVGTTALDDYLASARSEPLRFDTDDPRPSAYIAIVHGKESHHE
jgi:hypothetical protein